MDLAKRVAARYLTVIAQQGEQQDQEEQASEDQGQGQGQGQEQGEGESQGDSEGEEPNYGGKGPFSLPDDHVAAMQVPAGGACCAKCKFVDANNHACLEPNYVTWNGGDTALPDFPLDQICSDWFAAGPPEAGGGVPEGGEQLPAPVQGQGQGLGQGQQGVNQ